MDWLCGPGVIVDLRDEMGDLAVYTPKMIEKRVKVKHGDISSSTRDLNSTRSSGRTPDEERYIHMHPGAHPDMVPWLLKKRSTSGAWTAFPPTIR